VYFTFEEMSLEHLPMPQIQPFSSSDYYSPQYVFLNNVTRMPRAQFLGKYPDQRQENFVHIETDIQLFTHFIGAATTEESWQAFFDDVDFYSISDQSVLEFFIAMPDLTNRMHDTPSFQVHGHIARMLMTQFREIRDANDYKSPGLSRLFDEDHPQNDFYFHAYTLLDNGFHPTEYDGARLRFERMNVLENRISAEQNSRPYDDYGF